MRFINDKEFVQGSAPFQGEAGEGFAEAELENNPEELSLVDEMEPVDEEEESVAEVEIIEDEITEEVEDEQQEEVPKKKKLFGEDEWT